MLTVNCDASSESVSKYLGDYGDRLPESLNSVQKTKTIRYLKQKGFNI